MTDDSAPLTEAEAVQDSAGSYRVAIDALREMHRAGWRPPEDSPFRARREAE